MPKTKPLRDHPYYVNITPGGSSGPGDVLDANDTSGIIQSAKVGSCQDKTTDYIDIGVLVNGKAHNRHISLKKLNDPQWIKAVCKKINDQYIGRKVRDLLDMEVEDK